MSLQLQAQAILTLRKRGPRKGKYEVYADDPEGFAEDILGITLWSRQRELLRAVRDFEQNAVKAGRKVSKSYSIATICLWWVLAKQGRVLMTSSSYEQIKAIIWQELSVLGSKVNITVPLDPNTGVRQNNKILIQGRSTSKRENFQGYSGADMLYIVDEASGVDSAIFEAIDGNRAGGGSILMLGNPTQTVGYYYEAFTIKREFWNCLTISSLESPNITGELGFDIPGLATKKWVQQVKEEYGEDSPYFQIHVLGEFPTEGANNVIGLKLIDDAKKANAEATGALRLGLDVARYGDDDSVLQPVKGKRQLKALEFHGLDGPELAEKVIHYLEQYRRQGFTEKVVINVDVIGVGASAFDALNHHSTKTRLDYEVIAVNVAENATNEDYHRLRDQLWFSLADWLKEGGSLPYSSSRLEAEMLAAAYSFDTQGRYKVVSKDKMKELLSGKSPDRAEALMLAIYKAPAGKKAFAL